MSSILDDRVRSEGEERGETRAHVKKEEYWRYGPPLTGLMEVKFT